jgi:hypothetical protein
MTHSHSTLQKSEAQLLAQLNGINAKCQENKTLWQLDEERLSDYGLALTNANNAYAANNDPMTKTVFTVATKNAAIGELKHVANTFITYLELNIHVPDAALDAMGLRPRHQHKHEPLPKPTDQPVVTVTQHHEEITVYVSQPEHDHPTATVAPKKYHAFVVRYKVQGDAKYQTVVSTRLHHTLYFEHDDRGKEVLLAAAWVNPRLENGPWSDEISAIIG